jgi:plasmid replication initiation protein
MKNKKNKMLVTKDNRLVAAHYKLTAQEQKLVLTVVAMIQPSDADFQEYLVPVDEFKRLMGVEGRAYHMRLKQRAKSLLRKPLEIPQDDGGWLVANWFSSIKESPQEACVRIRFDPNLKPYLLSLKNQFTTFELHNAARLSSAYSIRLYELLKQYENTDIKERTFEFAALKRILGCENTYGAYGNFNQRVLQPAQKELSEKTDITFTYKVRKIGRRVNWIIFNIKPRKRVFIDDGQGSEIDMADVYSTADIPAEVLKWIPEACRSQHDVLRDVVNHLETHGLPYVVQKVAYTAKRKPRDFAAYLGNALKNNLGADFDPNQMEIFPESALLPKIAPGMRVRYEGAEYAIDEHGCIWPKAGGAMPSGRVRELIGSGQIQVVETK